MLVQVAYSVTLRNGKETKGKVKAKTGDLLQELMFRILDREGFKNKDSFILDHSSQKLAPSQTSISIKQRSPPRPPSKALSGDSQFEESSMDLEDQNKQFLTTEPEQPPTIRGQVLRSWRFPCCMSSRLFLQLTVQQLRIFRTNEYIEASQILFVNDIAKVRSYRKKQYFFLRLELEETSMDFRFTSSALCKEWVGYIMQSMTYNRYLNDRKAFSRSDSFTRFVNDLKETEKLRIVTLEEGQTGSVYEELPEEKTMVRQSKRIIKLAEFEVTRKIGSGSFSLVFWAKRGHRIFALKQLSKSKLLERSQMKYALTELRVLMCCRGCPYIIPLYYAFQTPNYLYLALQYVPSGDLSQLLRVRRTLTPPEALILVIELVYAIQFLHRRKIIYRDLKPDNILLDPKGHMYLVDFGLAKELTSEEELAESFLGTPLYLAPERFAGSGCVSLKSDIYGVGCVFYEMLHGESPFKSSSFHVLAQKIKNEQPDIDSSLPLEFRSFLAQTLEKDPEKRLPLMSAHNLFEGVDWKAISVRKHKGINMTELAPSGGVQIDYKIDEDYTEENYPERLVSGWEFSRQEEE